MRKFTFTVLFVENDKIKHRQIKSYSAFCAMEDFKDQNPNTIPFGAGLGSVNKAYWAELKRNEENIVKAVKDQPQEEIVINGTRYKRVEE